MSDDIPSKPAWRPWAFYIALTLGILFSIWFLMIRTPPLVVSVKTTRITGPLTADGQIDFLKAVEAWSYPPELATDDNGFRVFTRLFGDVADYGSSMSAADREFYRTQKYEKLGLDPKVPPTMVLPRDPFEIVKDHYKTTGVDMPDGTESNLRNKPWTLEQFPMLADWVKESDAPLDAIAEAIRKPIFMPPLLQSPQSYHSGKPQNLLVLLLPDVQRMRGIARQLQARATYRIGQGNIDGAIDDKLALLRLGRLISFRACLVQYVVGIAIQGIGYDIAIGADPKHPPTAAQLCRLLDGIDGLPPQTPTKFAFEWDRYMGLSVIQDCAHGGDLVELIGSGSRDMASILYFCNWNTVFRRMNEAYDAVQEQPPRAKINAMLSEKLLAEELLLHFLTSNGRATIYSNIFVQTLIPAIDAAEDAVRKSECAENMQRLTLGILLYQAEYGKLPDENWPKQIEKHLGKESGQIFRCPSSTIPDGETKYAMIQYGTEIPADSDTILLVELADPLPLEKAVVPVADVRNRKGTGSLHLGGMNVGLRSGAVRFVNSTVKDDELLPMLGTAVDVDDTETGMESTETQ